MHVHIKALIICVALPAMLGGCMKLPDTKLPSLARVETGSITPEAANSSIKEMTEVSQTHEGKALAAIQKSR